MHSAPSVSYPVGRSRGARRLLGAFWLAGAAGALVVCVQSYGFGWRQGLLLASVAAAGVCAWSGLRRATQAAQLDFDGNRWSLTGRHPLAAAQGRLVLDLQSLLLLRLQAAAGSRWLWLERRSAPERWTDLRCAVHARTSADTPIPIADGAGAVRHHPAS